MNNEFYEYIIESILFDLEYKTKKNWWHIFWYTQPFAYVRYNKLDNSSILLKENDYFLNIINSWRKANYSRSILDWVDFIDNYLYNFIYAISFSGNDKFDYYLRYSEKIDKIGEKKLLISYKQNPNYLFTNIALASYYQHNKNLKLAYAFYLNSLKLDKDNPYVLAKLSILFSSLWWEENLIKAEKTIKKVLQILPEKPWVNSWYWETLNMIWKYYEALVYFKKYEKLTEGKHRTFEPFMRKAESYIWLWDFKKARNELNKENKYYLWEWYRFVYNELDIKLKKLWY